MKPLRVFYDLRFRVCRVCRVQGLQCLGFRAEGLGFKQFKDCTTVTVGAFRLCASCGLGGLRLKARVWCSRM